MLVVIEQMVRFILLENCASSQTSRLLKVTSRPATWALSHLAHRLSPGKLLFKSRRCMTIQSRYAGLESVAR